MADVLVGALREAVHDRGYSAFNVRSINFVGVKNTQVVTPKPSSSAEGVYNLRSISTRR
jgi:hypothetical protein